MPGLDWVLGSSSKTNHETRRVFLARRLSQKKKPNVCVYVRAVQMAESFSSGVGQTEAVFGPDTMGCERGNVMGNGRGEQRRRMTARGHFCLIS